MKIWNSQATLESMNARSHNTFASHVGITFIELGDDYLKARMAVNEKTVQPLGILNGGVSAALAETVGSTAANYCVDHTKYYCVGLDINANHLRPARAGDFVIATASPIHLGQKTHVWHIDIVSESTGKRVCVSRLTMMVCDRVETAS